MDKSINARKIISIVIFIASAAIIVVHYRLYDLAEVTRIVSSTGKWAPMIFMVFCIIRPIVILPIGLFSVLGGLMFGAAIGTIYTVIGSTIGSVIAYYLAKLWGREWVEGFLKGKFKSLDDHCKNKGFTVTFLMRVIPILPCDVVSYIGGLSEIKLTDFILGTFLGIIPGTFIYSYFGNSLNNLYSRQFIISVILLLILSIIPIFLKKSSKKDLVREIGLDFDDDSKKK